MINIDELFNQLREFHRIPEDITFNLPQYIKFSTDLKQFIYENHFEETSEWRSISENLVYRSNQFMSREEADVVITQLEKLHRYQLKQAYEGIWEYVHPLIQAVSKKKLLDGHFADAVESAFKEINARLKKIYRKQHGEEKDGSNLMKSIFSPKNPVLIFEGVDTRSGEDVQVGYMEIFSGAMTGIRNPKAHENQIISREAAIKRLVFAGLLMDKIDEALKYSGIDE